MGLGWGEFVGVTGDNAPHSHHAVQVLLSDAPQPLWTTASGWEKSMATSAVRPGAPVPSTTVPPLITSSCTWTSPVL